MDKINRVDFEKIKWFFPSSIEGKNKISLFDDFYNSTKNTKHIGIMMRNYDLVNDWYIMGVDDKHVYFAEINDDNELIELNNIIPD